MSSNNVDNRVVNMQFNNSQFESGINQTIQSLSNLKSSLKFDNATSGLQSVQSAVDSLSFANIESSVASLESRFSTLGIVGMSAISNITDKVINLGTQIASTLTNQIVSGGTTRYKNIADAKFQIEGLGKDWEALYEDMDYAVSGTAYGIDEAAKAASSLSASGIEAGEDMKQALRGISGVAAMTNSDYSTMADVFTTVAGQGKLMTQQLRQLESRGLNAAATLADYLGTTEASVRDMVSNGEIDFDTFSSAMDDAFGEHATKANETFSGALSNMKASLSRIGENFSRPIYERLIGPLNDLRQLFDKVKNKLTDFTGTLTGGDWYNSPFGTFVGALSNKIRTLIQNVNLDWLDTLVDYLNEAADAGTYFITNYEGVIDTIKNYLTETGKVTDENSAIMQILTSLSNVGKAVKNVFSSVSIIFQTLVSAFKEVFNIGDASSGVLTLSEVLLKLSEAMTVTEEDAEQIKPIFIDVFTVIKRVVDGIISFTSALSNYFGPIFRTVFNYMIKFYRVGSDVINTIIEMVSGNEKLSELFNNIQSGFKKSKTIAEGFSKTFSGVVDFLKNISPKTWGIVALGVILVNLVKKFSAFSFAIKRVTALANNVASFGNTFSNVFKGLAYYSRSVATVAVIKEVAIAIVALAASLALLTLVDSTKLVTATKCVASLIAIMAAFAIAMTQMAKNLKSVIKVSVYMASISTMFLGISISILILVAALAKLSTIDTTNIWKNFAVLSALFGELVAAAILLSVVSPVLSKGASALVFYAAAVYVLVLALEKLTQVNIDGIGEKLVTLGAVMLALIGISKIANGVSFGAPIGILAMIASIWLIEKMLKYIINEGVNFEDVKNNIDRLAIALGSFIVVAVILKVLSSKSKGMIKMATSIVLLATSVYIITSAIRKLADIENPNALSSAVRALIVVFIGVIAMMEILSKGGSSVKRAGSTILLISLAILIISSALKSLASIKDTSKMFTGLLAIILSLISIVAVLTILSETVKHVKVSGILAMAVLIAVIGAALTMLTTIGDTDKMLEAAGGIGIVLLAVAVSLSLVSRFTKLVSYMAVASLYSMILLLIAISASILMLSKVGDIKQMYASVGAIALVLAAVCIALIAVSNYSKSVMPNSLILLGLMIEALVVIAGSLLLLSKAGDMNKVFASVVAIMMVITVLSAAFVAISTFGSTMNVPAVVALGLMILVLLSIAASLRLLLDGGYDWEQMKGAVKAMVIVLASVAVALSILAVVSDLTGQIGMVIAGAALAVILLTLSVAMASFAKLVDTLVKSLTQLTKIKYNQIDLGVLTKLVLLLAALGVVASITGVGFVLLGVGLTTVGIGLTLITANVAIITTLITKFTLALNLLITSLTMMGLMAPIIAEGIKTIGSAVASTIGEIGKGIATGIANFLTTIASKGEEIKAAIKTILSLVLSTITETLVELTGILLDFIVNILTLIDDNAPTITEKCLSILITVLKGIAAYSTVIGYYGAIIAVGFVSGLIQGITAMIPDIVSTVEDLAIAIVMAFSEMMDNAGTLAADSLKVSLLSGTKATGDFVNELIGKDIFDTETVQGEIDYQRDILKENMKKNGEEAADAEADGYSDELDSRSDEMSNKTAAVMDDASNKKDISKKNGSDNAKATVSGYTNTLSNSSDGVSSSLTELLNNATSNVDLSSFTNLGGDASSLFGTGLSSNTSQQETKYKISELSDQAISEMKKAGWYESGEYLVKDVQSGIENSTFSFDSVWGDASSSLLSSADDTADDMSDKGTTTGENYGDGLIDGLLNKQTDINETYASVMSGADEAARNAAEVNSPSRKAIRLSEFYGVGLSKGLINMIPTVMRSAAAIANSITESVNIAFETARNDASGLTLDPTISPIIDGTNFKEALGNIDDVFNNNSSVQLATSSAISLNDANAFTINDRLDALNASIDKLANTDYSKMLEGVNINVDASTNVDGTPLRRMSSAYTIQQINDTQNGLIMAAGGRV